ncbi:Alpha/Beta hydrolase protein [Ephemerocybe angulata]|uniref:Alpha/Beta hydrolase protein n=1 Tax=Ephemerocybe angulata TaxID=980116 RepID=A0A8H6M5R3_9AGAR|nr:Alpha/Beta hydrolase protein [Tulosesus angulatus]
MAAETPFKVSIPEAKLEILKKKLDLIQLPNEIEGAGWEYGAPLSDIQRLTKYWKDEYLPKWRDHEAKLNEDMPQFTKDINVEGFSALKIQYVHQKSAVKGAIPLLFVHGWPGSFIEVRKVLPLLVQGSADHPAFHVVALSLPNFGFSEGPKTKGFELTQYAEVCHKLMISLGYDEYVTQGGDWGMLTTRKITQLYGGKHCKAYHTNTPTGSPPHPIRRPLLLLQHLLFNYSPKEQAGLDRTQKFWKEQTGFFAQQTTMPQTLGYGLADSPVGLLAWIYEKLVGWSDDYKWTDEEVLTWISIHWFAEAGPAASIRIYYEVIKATPDIFTTPVAISVPEGISAFPKDNVVLPRR